MVGIIVGIIAICILGLIIYACLIIGDDDNGKK